MKPKSYKFLTNDQIEQLAKQCGWDNKKYMTPKDYQIWCDKMRMFASLLAPIQAQPYIDKTIYLSVGESSFESWFESYKIHPKNSTKQLCRDAYAAGMGDPLVTPAQEHHKLITNDDAEKILLSMAAHIENFGDSNTTEKQLSSEAISFIIEKVAAHGKSRQS